MSSATIKEPQVHEDRGGILIFTLITIVIISFIAIPMLAYTSAVLRAGEVQADRAQAVELANGGTWVALSNEQQLYDLCSGGVTSLPSSLDDVVTTCQLLDTETLRPATEMPFQVASVLADTALPAEFASSQTYVNPNTSADHDLWLADYTLDPTENKVWLPRLPVQATSTGGNRASFMPPGTFNASYSDCLVFFPGTFTDPINIDQPAYFTSGVYYFTEPITLENGADVVVGNGAEVGCTNDFEAVSFAASVPDPLNMSGLGGTFVLGENARITVDDSGSGDIKFAINQRYVSTDETSVQASSDVAIISVNGAHEPFLPSEAYGQDFDVPGAINVPASTVGTDGDPAATDSGYLPSVLTVKSTEPDAPIITSVEIRQEDDGNVAAVDDGAAIVTWSIPNYNGSFITSYTATDATTGNTCQPTLPTLPDTTVQPSCTIFGIEGQGGGGSDPRPQISVTATNAVGTSAPSPTVQGVRVDLTGGTQSDEFTAPGEPLNVTVGASYVDGLEITWDEPSNPFQDELPVIGYRVEAEDASGTLYNCEAHFNERSCVLPLPATTPDTVYNSLRVWAAFVDEDGFFDEGAPSVDIGPYTHIPGAGNAPVQIADVEQPRVPSAIVDFTTTNSTSLDVDIAGYVAVPQGRVAISAATPANVSISMIGGLLAGEIFLDPAGVPTGGLDVFFDNPVAQKRVQITSVATGDSKANSEAIVQVNRSGSLAINSWVVQAGTGNPAPVTPTNAPPVATNQSAAAMVGTAEAITLSVSDADGDSLTVTDIVAPAGVTATASGTTMNVTASSVGTFDITYRVTDGTASSAIATLTVTATTSTPTNTPPVANNQSAAATVGTAEAITLSVSDADGDSLTVTDIVAPAGVTATASGTTMNVTASSVGTFDITYRVTDGTDSSGIATLTVTATAPTNTGPTHPTITGASGQPIGNHPEVDYCASGQTGWTHDFGSGTWLGEYWHFDDSMNTGNFGQNIFVGAPDFNHYVSEINNNWGSGAGASGVSNYFGIRYTATINVPDNCTMDLQINGDDGYAVYVDGSREADHWSNHGNSTREGTVTLSPGEHLVVVEWYEWGGGARIELKWSI